MSKPSQTVQIGMDMSLEEYLTVMFLTPMGDPIDPGGIWGAPCMLHGSPGIAKTARIRQASARLALECHSVELGGRQPEDASGVPFLTKNAQGQDVIMIACLLGAVNRLNHVGEGVLFFDELSCARPATQGAFLTAMQERRIGDTLFSPRIRVVAAGNPPNESAGAFLLAPPMANRLAHRDVLPPNADDFGAYLMSGGKSEPVDRTSQETKIIDGWAQYWSQTAGALHGFARKHPAHVHSVPPMGDPNRTKAFPTPRSLEMGARAITTARILGKDESKQMEIMASCIGAAATEAWVLFLKDLTLPDPKEVLSTGWKINRDRLDMVYAVLTSVTTYVVTQNTLAQRVQLAPACWKFIHTVVEAGLTDLALKSSKALIKNKLGTAASKEVKDAAIPVLVRFANLGFEEFLND